MNYLDTIAECNPSQTHSELQELLTLLEKIDIKNVLEIGVHRGGSIKVWQKVFNPTLLIGIDGLVEPEFRAIEGVEIIEGYSQAPEIYQKVVTILGDRELDFIFIDGSHYYEDVKKDFEMYSPLVREGGAIAFHDVIIIGNKTCAVNRYWDEIKDKHNSTTISHKATFGSNATGVGIIWK